MFQLVLLLERLRLQQIGAGRTQRMLQDSCSLPSLQGAETVRIVS